MKNTLKRIIALSAIFVMLLGILPTSAASYTYSISGQALASPDAYTPEKVVDSLSIGLTTQLSAPTDIETDSDGNVYIADPKNNRIIVLDRYYNLKFSIAGFTNSSGISTDALAAPSGVFVWEGLSTDKNGDYVIERLIYVADTNNERIVVFDESGKYIKHFNKPKADIFDEGQLYQPTSLAVDRSGRIFVVSTGAYQGIISLTSEGVFSAFVGAQKASYNPLQLIWRKFQTAEQRENSELIVSTEFNNITMDSKGFIYITTNSINESDQAGAIRNPASEYHPVKMINTAGEDVMKRNGFFTPCGEVSYTNNTNATIRGVSQIVDAAIGPENTWSIIDQKRSKIFTYDDNGELLFAFGDQGTQLGNLQKAVGITYQGEKMLVLDGDTSSFTVYKRTDYGNTLIQAIKNNNDRKYSLAVEDWENILKQNNNFDAAYIGLGEAYYRQGDWDTAMEYYKVAYDVENYSAAYKMQRKDIISKYIVLIPIIAVAVCAFIYFFFRYAGKVNSAAAVSGKKKTLKEELLYAFHVIFHPFDGFWDLKHEKRGSLRAAFIILGVTVLAFTYQALGQSYIFNPRGSYTSVIAQLAGLLVPLVLWVVANWCLTTLFEGEGSIKDVFIATCYSLTPIILLLIPSTLLTHWVTLSEAGFVNILVATCYVWVGFLLFFGTMVTHDYSLGKNTLTILGTIVGMCLIMFIGILFSSLLIKMVSFVSNIITEIQYSM